MFLFLQTLLKYWCLQEFLPSSSYSTHFFWMIYFHCFNCSAFWWLPSFYLQPHPAPQASDLCSQLSVRDLHLDVLQASQTQHVQSWIHHLSPELVPSIILWLSCFFNSNSSPKLGVVFKSFYSLLLQIRSTGFSFKTGLVFVFFALMLTVSVLIWVSFYHLSPDFWKCLLTSLPDSVLFHSVSLDVIGLTYLKHRCDHLISL